MDNPIQSAEITMDRMRSMNIFQCHIDKRAIDTFEALELLYWNEWEAACKFQDSTKQDACMRKISLINDVIEEFKQEDLGR